MKRPFLLGVTVWGWSTFNAFTATHYVSLGSPNPSPPYTNWETAARVIQDAVDAAKDGDTVLVTNGVYNAGSRQSHDEEGWSLNPSRVVVTNSIRLESVNGFLATTIAGDPVDGIRCVALCKATLSGFTLTQGWALDFGGGAYGGTLYDCTLTNNMALESGGGAYRSILNHCNISGNSANEGGGAAWSTLNDCTVTRNRADSSGGGVIIATLNNCVLSGNWAGASGGGVHSVTLNNCIVSGNSAGAQGGGAAGGTARAVLSNCTLVGNSAGENGGGVIGNCRLYNCILYFNNAPAGPNYATTNDSPNAFSEYLTLNYCCTIPLPADGAGNIVGPPLFMNMADGDYRLREDSPCIDTGTNLYLAVVDSWPEPISFEIGPTDSVGNTRFIDGNGDGKVAWDIGAYEFNSFKPPRFSGAPELTAQGWKFTVMGDPRKWVGLQRTSDFTGWWDLKPPMLVGADGTCEIIDADTGPKVMFYRAVVVP